MLIRHAEKPDKGSVGIDALGKPDASGLSLRGWQRAEALVDFFAAPDAERGIRRPRAIFAAVDERRSRRPALTVLPLARALELPIHANYGSESQPEHVVAAALAREGPVLLCWRHRALPPLAAALVGDRAPDHWDEDRFDLVWLLEQTPDGAWNFRVLPQQLLPGDGGNR
jgi:hypothetical protein